MNEITSGMSETAVKAILGEPDDTDSTQMKDFEGATTTMDNWTYGNMFTDGATWMLSYTDCQLNSKRRI